MTAHTRPADRPDGRTRQDRYEEALRRATKGRKCAACGRQKPAWQFIRWGKWSVFHNEWRITVRTKCVACRDEDPDLPSRPVAVAILEWARRRRVSDHDACRMLRLGDRPLEHRMLEHWRYGSKPTLAYSKVDSLLTTINDRHWWDVFTARTVRRPVITVSVYRWREKEALAGDVMYAIDRVGQVPYGDLGPDLYELERIRAVYEYDQLAMRRIAHFDGQTPDGLCAACERFDFEAATGFEARERADGRAA
jgi:hypothetical protein